MFCEKCCKEIPENAKFCPFCGTKQTGNHTQLLPDNMPKESSSPPSNMQKESTPPQTDIESAKIWGGIIFFSIIAIIAIVIFTKQTSIVNSTPVKTANTMAKAPVTPAPPTKVKVPIPASFQAVSVDENIIGEPTVSVSLKNNSDKLIDAFKIAVSAKNNYNDKIGRAHV